MGKPFALAGVRIIDLTWMLASAGAGRFFTALGAEVIKVEHTSRLDGMRMGMGNVPPGGRAERDSATKPIVAPPTTNVNRSGSFMEINAGKRSFSLNLKHPRGKELLVELLKDADMVIEGFSPGTMDRMGLGYERLREINPKIVYVQQSGMGQIGTLWTSAQFWADGPGLFGTKRHVGSSRTLSACRHRLFLSGLVWRLPNGVSDDGGTLSAETNGQRLLDQLFPGRSGALSHGYRHLGAFGKRPSVAPLRQQIALQTRCAAWCLSRPW